MKTIYSMGKGKYITLDSYGESHGTRRWSFAIALLALLLAAITGGALVGVDITSPSTKAEPTSTDKNHEYSHRFGY